MCVINPKTISILTEKASNSPCTYRVSAIAFDHKGDILGHATNNHSKNWNVLEKCKVGRPGTGTHAERKLMARYGENIKTILICRVGNDGDILPIDPCDVCRKVADKLGIKIVSVMPGKKLKKTVDRKMRM